MPTMEDALEAFFSAPDEGCVVNRWIKEQSEKTQEMLSIESIKERRINLSNLYKHLSKISSLPFQVTIFRMHYAGTCKCQ